MLDMLFFTMETKFLQRVAFENSQGGFYMKKFAKFLGIFLALSMVIGMLSVVGAVDPEPTAPAAPTGDIKQGTVLEVVSPTKIETVFGYYEENAIDDPDAFVDCEDGACVTDGWFGRAGYSECTLDDGTIGLIMTIDEVTTIGGIEIVGKNANNNPVDFDVQALVNGAWVTVVSVDANPFTDGLTKTFTFDAVETNTVRILVNAVGAEGEECYFNEVTLFTPVAGNLKTVLDLDGLATSGDADVSSNNNWLVDGDKSTFFTGSTVVITLPEATAIDGFSLFHYRSDRTLPHNVTISILKTEGGAPEEIGTFATGFGANPQDSLYVTFDQTYMAYAVQITSDTWGYMNDFELWQYQREASEPVPTAEPTQEPTAEPTQEPTQEPTAEPTQEPTAEPTQEPTAEPTQEPSAEPTEPAEALPEAPVVVPGTNVVGTVKTGKVYKIVSPTRLTTKFGAYTDVDLTIFDDGGDGYCVTDGWYGRSGFSERNAAHGKVALIMTLDQATTIGAIEIVGHSSSGNDMTNFTIQAYVNGEWVTVKTVESNPFAEGKRTVKYTFPAVETTEVRILVNDWENTSDSVKLAEVSLFEVVDGKLYNVINVADRIVESDGNPAHPTANLFDGDKSNIFLGSSNVINLTVGGQPTAVDGIALYHYRGGQSQPGVVTIKVQKTEGGEYETIGTFGTFWSNTYPIDSLFAEFDQTYVAYALVVSFDAYAYATEFELIQYQQEAAPVEPPVDPTEPSEPATEPSEPATEPSEPATEPSEPATEPSEPATEPSEPATEPSEPATEPSEPTTEPSEPTDEPILPGEELDLTDLEATFALLENLDREDYTEESALAVDEALAVVLLIMADENCTQEMLDAANAALLEAINNLVLIEEPDVDEPGEELPDVPELPGAVDLTEIEATIDLIYDLDPSLYTAESYANLVEVVKEVNKIIATEGGYTQKMIDAANDMLMEALTSLILIDGAGTPDGGDDDLPADTGDVMLSVLTGMMTLSAIGGAVVVGKKKF
ncbi:MAG: discoidin domain-containing protein [Oscillospiraceae bacterium]|nr:discoidin domain-containing protein [Oscillospiraceae bacterium]